MQYRLSFWNLIDAVQVMNIICIHSILLNREVSYESSQ